MPKRDRSVGPRSPVWSQLTAALANALVFAVLIVAAVLEATDSDLYYRSAQEDGILEWMTFWGFALAAAAFAIAGTRLRSAGLKLPWFLWGVAAFCLFVALEEISWGQRLVGYRPPEYFLRENFQQEFNIHNVFATSLRKLLLKTVILGYGVVFPLVARPRAIRKVLDRLGIIAPPLALAPAFLVTFIAYEAYPWSFTGEWVELMLGLGFLFAGTSHLRSTLAADQRPWRPLVIGLGLTLLLGIASARLSQLRPSDTPAMISAAKTEIEALARDFTVRGRPISRCGIHKRVYSFVEKYKRNQLYRGEYSRLVDQGMPDERAGYFLDPWNSPIWIRHKCSNRDRKQVVFLYSFGPDRRRDSSSWEILGDDVGVVVLERGN